MSKYLQILNIEKSEIHKHYNFKKSNQNHILKNRVRTIPKKCITRILKK